MFPVAFYFYKHLKWSAKYKACSSRLKLTSKSNREMPRITRWFIKSGIIYLFLGIVLAFLSELPFIQSGTLLLPVYWHMIVIGWITQIIMGVSIWMFPRKRRDRKKTETFAAVTSFWSLNAGLLLRFLCEPFLPFFTKNPLMIITISVSILLQLAGILFYVFEIWPRVQSKKKRKQRST
jgi:magnesium-transporting ATPase (P-type)